MTSDEVQALLPNGFFTLLRDDGIIDIFDEVLHRKAGSINKNFVVIKNCYKVALLCHLDRPDLGLVLTTRQPALTR